MRSSRLWRRLASGMAVIAVPLSLCAAPPDAADSSIQQFLAHDDLQQHPYRATRRLEAENGDRRAWLEVITEFSAASGFSYRITDEGGSGYLRGKVLRPVLDGERDAIAAGETSRSALAPENYLFQANGVDAEGLANILLSPRRKERVLVAGTMFLRPDDGNLVRLQGRLAKSPSFWVKSVEIVKRYNRIAGVVVPIALEANAQTRFFGAGRLRMIYTYWEIDGQPLAR